MTCAALADALEPIASGVPATPEQRAHWTLRESAGPAGAGGAARAGCSSEWPVPAPTPAFTLRVAEGGAA